MEKRKNTRLTVDEVMAKAVRAAAAFEQLDQEQTDRIVKKVCEAGFKNREHLAKLAYEETGLGKWQDKVTKNIIATRVVYEDIKNLKTVGIISENPEAGIIEIAQPIGPIFAVTPITNPSSTVLFKSLIALTSASFKSFIAL